MMIMMHNKLSRRPTLLLFCLSICLSSGIASRLVAQTIPCEELRPQILSTACTNVCAGSSVVLDAGQGYSSYTWSNGSTTQRIVLNSVEANGTYWCDVVTAEGCRARTNALPVRMYPAPAKPYIVQQDTVLLATEAAHIIWMRNGKTLPAQDQQRIIVHDSADYQIIISDEHGCSASSDVVQSRIVSNGQSTRGNDARLKVYPNPTSGQIAVQLLSDYVGDITFSIADLQGKEVFTGMWKAPRALEVFNINLSAQPDGSYILTAIDGVDVVTSTVILQH